MNKQLDIMMNENVTTAEVQVKKPPLIRYLTMAAIGVGVFIVLVLLFALGGSVINPAVESTMQKLGLGDQIVAAETSPVAYAWKNPGEFQNSLAAGNMKNTSNTNTLVPKMSSATIWNWGTTLSAGCAADGSWSVSDKTAYSGQLLFYADIYIDATMQNAIKNGQVTTFTVSLASKQVGGAFWRSVGNITGSYFLCSSSTGNSSAGLNDMGDSFNASATDRFDIDIQGSRVDMSFDGTINLTGQDKKIRFGVYYNINKNSSTVAADVFAPAPTYSGMTTDGYNNSHLKIGLGGVGSVGGNIVSLNSSAYGNKNPVNSFDGTCAYNSSHIFGGTVIDNIKAEANPGYYFAGWTVTGTVTATIDKTSTTLALTGGAYLKGTVTVIAVFRQITVENLKDIYYYTQEWSGGSPVFESDGVTVKAVGQGPYVNKPTGISGDTIQNFAIGGGIHSAAGLHTFSSEANMYQALDDKAVATLNTQPKHAGFYRMMVGIFENGEQTNSNAVLGYVIIESFEIKQIAIDDSTLSTTSIASRAYSSFAYTPTPSVIDIEVGVGSGTYRLRGGVDYDMSEFSYANNINVSKADPASLQYKTLNKNFNGQGFIYFNITQLDINDFGFTYDTTMAKEIMWNYGTLIKNASGVVTDRVGLTYNGYEQRPEVLLIRIKGKVFKAGSSTERVDSNLTEVTFTIYSKDYNKTANLYKDYYVFNGDTVVEQYKPLDGGSIGAGNTSYYIKTKEGSSEILDFKNNINICTYDGSGADADCASFDIVLEDNNNMKGEMTCFFNIQPLDLTSIYHKDNYTVLDVSALTDSYTSGLDTDAYVYYGGVEIKPIPEVVYVKVSGLNPWYKDSNGLYSQNAAFYDVTFAINRTDGNAVWSNSVQSNTGISYQAGANVNYLSASVFTEGFNNSFASKGEADSEVNPYAQNTYSLNYTYSNNIEVTYAADGSTYAAAASITIPLVDGNIKGIVTTHFVIEPRDLSSASPNGKHDTVGVFAFTIDDNGSYIENPVYVENYTGSAITPSLPVLGYANTSKGIAPELTEGKDFVYSYANNETVTQSAVIIATGQGNYKGSVSAYFYITAMNLDDYTVTISPLDAVYYTGNVISPDPQEITFTVSKGSFNKEFTVFTNVISTNNNAVSIVAEKQGENLYVTPSTGNRNYITVKFVGLKADESDLVHLGTSTVGTDGRFYSTKEYVIDFDIQAKDISTLTTAGEGSWRANWLTYQEGKYVQYDGTSKQGLTIVWNEEKDTDNTVVIRDLKASSILDLQKLHFGASEDLLDQGVRVDYVLADNAWGENINAGITAGSVTFKGVGNYTGTITLYFQIMPRRFDLIQTVITLDMSEGSGYDSTQLGYYFTGDSIKPLVTSMVDNQLGVTLKQDVDFVVHYGKYLADDSERLNVYVQNGGKVTLEGIGNYANETATTFNILPVEQEVWMLDPYKIEENITPSDKENTRNNPLELESKATDLTKQVYADYQIDASPNNMFGEITLIGYTTALYPVPRMVTFTVKNLSGSNATIASVTYESLEKVTIDGVEVAKTTAKLRFSGYGVIRIFAEQLDNDLLSGGDKVVIKLDETNPNGILHIISKNNSEHISYSNHGNYLNSKYDAYNWGDRTKDDAIYSIYGKRQDSVSGGLPSSYTRVYGNDNEKVEPGLASYNAVNQFHMVAEGLTDDGAPVVRIIGDSGATRYIEFANAGTAVIKIYHDGFINETAANDSEAYMPFTRTINVTVEKRQLHISINPLTVEYGINPLTSTEDGQRFVLSFVTKDNSTNGDPYTGLSYGDGKYDSPEQIITNIYDTANPGVIIKYNPDDHKGVTGVGLTHTIIVEAGGVIEGAKYDNYQISYFAGNLTVVKKKLEAFVTNTGIENLITKVYGTLNPTDYTVAYRGFVYNENEDAIITAPSVDYSSLPIDANAYENGNQCSYKVALKGGVSGNYEIVECYVTVTIEQAEVELSLNAPSFDYDGKRKALDASYVTVTKVGGSGAITSEPIRTDGDITFRYDTNQAKDAPFLAGSYIVWVTFNAAEFDNYKITTKRFDNALVINRVAPSIIFSELQAEWTGSPLPLSYFQVSVRAVEGGRTPLNTEVKEIYFAPVKCTLIGTDEYGNDLYEEAHCQREQFTLLTATNAPTDIGIYDIVVVYVANAGDVYCDTEETFKSSMNADGIRYVEITRGLATINIRNDHHEYEYNGSARALDIETDFADIIFTPKGSSEIVKLNKANAVIEYEAGIDNNGKIIYGLTAPKDAGTYSVRVTYTPTADEEVAKTVKIFTNAITITQYDLSAHNGIGLNIVGFKTFTFDALSHALTVTDVVLQGAPIDVANGIRPSGSINIQFTHIETGVSVDAPLNVGSYKATIVYTSLESGDNYTASSKYETDKVIQITPANVNIELDGTYTYNFTGEGKQIQGVSYYGVPVDGGYDVPQGKLQYAYRTAGTMELYSSQLPTNAGTYDVEVTFVPATNSNYSQYTKRFTSVITIKKVFPTIVINKMSFAYGDPIVVDYVVRGASYDLEGPMNTVGANVTIQYGTRYTTEGGGIGYDWSSSVPTASGTYSVWISYNPPTLNSNYEMASQIGYDVLVINNILPTFELENEVATYDGNSHVSATAKLKDRYGNYYTKFQGVDEGLEYYYGIISYQYRATGAGSSVSWTDSAPVNVGSYDVRITYTENRLGDVFSSTSATFIGAVKIEELVITVMPIYGQGHVYNGMSADGNDVAYVYTYVQNGYKYMVYSMVGDLERNEILDLSKAEYVDQAGNVYSIVTDASLLTDAWRDYYQRALSIVSATFKDGDEELTVNYSDLNVTSGLADYTSPSGKKYVLDLDNSFAYLDNGFRYELSVERGYYFSVVDSYGAVKVIEVDLDKLVYTGANEGILTITTAGIPTNYVVNLNTLKATANGEVYDIYNTVGLITYTDGVFHYSERIDYSSAFLTTTDGKLIYVVANGDTYLIDLSAGTVNLIVALSIKDVEFNYYDIDGEVVNQVVNASKLNAMYTANAYIGYYEVRTGLNVIINLANRTVRIPTFYDLTIENAVGGTTYKFTDAYGENFILTAYDFIKTETPNVYIYDFYGDVFYVDVANEQVRSALNLFEFNVVEESISQVVDGIKQSISVDVREFQYDIIRNGKRYDKIKLYDEDYDVEKSTLIGGVEFSGNFALMAQSAGEYRIELGTLAAGRNYEIDFIAGTHYLVDRKELTIKFTNESSSVYDGENKVVEFVIEGLLGYDEVETLLIYDGDNLNVTSGGYSAVVSIDSDNYVLVGGRSDVYFIEPAVMAPIVVEKVENIVYDGAKHILELKNVERGATVTYAGGDSAPYFVAPGTYSVIAVVSKPNYVSQEVELRMTIAKALYTVTALEVPGSLKYGDALPELRCDSDLGTIKLDTNQILSPLQEIYTWTFTPNSSDFFKYYQGNAQGGNAITGTIKLDVQKAQAKIELSGELVQSLTKPETLRSFINGEAASVENVTIIYVGTDGMRYSQMPQTAGKYTVLVTYAGDDNYAETTYETILTIEQESNLDWLYVVGIALLVLTVFSTVFFLMRRRKSID